MQHDSTLVRTTNSAISVWTVVQVARSEVRSILRLFRFWLVFLLLSGASMSAYVLSCLVSVNIAPFNVSFGGGTPLYLLGNLDPAYFLFFQTGLLLLLLDQKHRIRRNRIEEVIESQPVRNLEYQIGHTLCFSGLIWAIVCVNVLSMQLFGVVSELFNFHVAGTIQLHSVFNLLFIDAPVSLLIWASLFLLLTKLFRSRVLVLFSGLSLMIGHYLWTLNTPIAFVDLISHSSNQSLYVSDILPALPSTTSWIMRIATLLLVIALLALGAWCYRRSDSTNQFWTKVFPLTSLGVSVLVFSSGVLFELYKSNEVKNWREMHLTHEWNSKLDVQSIQGSVHINPRKQMEIDLTVTFEVVSQSTVESLVFTLNPGYRISTVHIDETRCDFGFDKGLLEVVVPFEIEPSTDYKLEIVAAGKPNPRFAYINASYDYLGDRNFPVQALHSFGTDGSIFNSRYVALMPGVYWYPVPGPVPRAADDDSLRSDFFNVELQVQLNGPPSWKLVGPATTVPSLDEPALYVTKPKIPIASIGLFASEFVEFAHDFQNFSVALYFHSLHAKKFLKLSSFSESLLADLEETFSEYEDQGVSIPFQTISFVEIPNRLRTVGGGWQMDRLNSLPSLALMKERGFPTMNIDYLIDLSKRRDSGSIEYIWGAFVEASTLALGSDNLMDAFQDQYWQHVVSVSGEHQQALNLIFRELSNELTANYDEGLFSVYATAQAARMTGLNVPAAIYFSRNRSLNIFDRGQLARTEGNYSNRFSVWNVMERTALPSLTYHPDNHKQDFEVLYLKSRLISRAIGDYRHYQLGAGDQVEPWLLALRRDFFCQQFTFDDALRLAQEHDLNFGLFLPDWLSQNTLAGFEVSSSTTTRVADSDDGSRRFLFSFEIANTQSTPGFVMIPAARSFSGFILPEHTAKRVTILLKRDSNASLDHTYNINAYTGLSLNRGPIVFMPLQNVDVDESLEPIELLEPSDFVPTQNGITVDDLDAGFITHQRKPVRNWLRYAPQDWFLLPILHEEFDGVLPNVGSSGFKVPRSSWLRFDRGSAYGKYRRTVAITSMTNTRKIHPIRFVTNIPEAGQWFLEYYLHSDLNSDLYASIKDFNLEIENGSSSWNKLLYPDPFVTGWKFVGEFELERGKTDVVVVGATEPSIVYADAIRWRKVAEQE